MAGEFANDRVAVFVGVFADGFADFSDKMPGLRSFHADFETLFGAFDEATQLRIDVTDQKHTRCVGVIAVLDGRYVDIDDVAVKEELFFRRYAVAHDFVDAGAAVFGEAFVTVGGADGTVVGRVFGHEAIDGFGAHAFLDFGGYHVENAGVDDAGTPNSFDVFGGFDERIGRHDETFVLKFEDTAVEVGGSLSCRNNPILFM